MDKIVEYIKVSRKQNIKDEEIFNNLKQVGWSGVQIKQAFTVVDVPSSVDSAIPQAPTQQNINTDNLYHNTAEEQNYQWEEVAQKNKGTSHLIMWGVILIFAIPVLWVFVWAFTNN